jgi:hypothetical protein
MSWALVRALVVVMAELGLPACDELLLSFGAMTIVLRSFELTGQSICYVLLTTHSE